MRICFFGWQKAFDYYQIGGTESYIRRLSEGLITLGHQVEYVMYGAKTNNITTTDTNIQLTYLKKYSDAQNLLSKRSFESIVNVYIHPKYRLSFRSFRLKKKKQVNFSTIIFSTFRSKVKSLLASLDLRSYNQVIAVSNRIRKQLARNSINSILLHPPVSDVFFETAINRKHSQKQIIVGYIGRIDYGKGFDLIDKLFSKISGKYVKPIVFTYSWKSKNAYLNPKNIKYEIRVTEYTKYGFEIEKELALLLGKIDFLILPYRTLSTTIDMPLSLIEGLIAGCTVISTNIAEIAAICRWMKGNCILLNLNELEKLEAEDFINLSKKKNSFTNINDEFSKFTITSVAKEFIKKVINSEK